MAVVVIGIDPGQSVGLAVMYDARRLAIAQGPWAHVRLQLESELQLAVSNPNVSSTVIGIERFIMRRNPHIRMTHQPATQQVVGAVADIATRYDVEMVEQSSADAKRLVTNSILNATGLRVRPLDVSCPDANDVNDALRHALLLLSRRHATVVAELFRPTHSRQRG